MIRRIEKIAIHAFEIAADALVANDALDGVDGRGMAFGRQLCAVFAMQSFQFEEPFVEHGGQLRGGSFGFPGDNRPVIQDDYGLAGFREQIRRGQADHPCADNTDIGRLILRETRKGGPRCRGHPNGSRLSGVGVHAVGSWNWSHALKE